MNNKELKEAIAKYIESKELVLMAYPPEYIDDVNKDMEIAFNAGAEWMAGQGVSFDTEMSWLDGFGFQIGWPEDTSIFDCFNPGDKVVVQIRKK